MAAKVSCCTKILDKVEAKISKTQSRFGISEDKSSSID